MANNRAGLDALQWLVARGSPPAGLVVHPAGRARHRDEIVSVSGLDTEDIIEGPAVGTAAGLAWLEQRAPEWIISVYFGYLLAPPALRVPSIGALNLHPALLPYNRGAHPNVWSLIEGTPAGVTLHWVDEGVDTGDIAAQREVQVLATDTAATLYQRLEDAALALFRECWPAIVAGTITRTPQPSGGTVHGVRDIEQLDRIDPARSYRADELINILRARTFPPYDGAYLDLGDRRVYLRIELVEG
jgi:methionyl-tRNA formyltransferase